jgi:chromosome segregation ATPase
MQDEDVFSNFVEHIAGLEREVSELKSELNSAKRQLVNKDIDIGRLNSDRLKAQKRASELEDEIQNIRERTVDRGVFNDKIDSLIAMLFNMRKNSSNEVERKTFQDLLEVLTKSK